MEKVWAKGADAYCVHPGQHALRGWSEVGKWWHTVLTQSVASDTRVDMGGIRWGFGRRSACKFCELLAEPKLLL